MCKAIGNTPKALSIFRDSTVEGAERKRLKGAGRHVLYPDLDKQLAEWVRKLKRNNQVVSRSMISERALEIFDGTEVKVDYSFGSNWDSKFILQVSNGWLSSFMNRYGFAQRRAQVSLSTTDIHQTQPLPTDYAEAVATFLLHVEGRNRDENFSNLADIKLDIDWIKKQATGD